MSNNEFDRMLLNAREDYDRALHARQRLDALRPELEPLRLQIEDLAAKRAKEEQDVSRMEAGSLTAFFLALFGKAEEKLTREREEALQAAIRHDAACAQLKVLQEEIDRLMPEAAALPAVRVAYERLLAEKKQQLAAFAQYAEPLLALEERIASQKRHQREVQEAIRAATRALHTAEEAVHELEEAEKLGNWDVFGGGMLVDFAKHEHMDAAQEAVNRLRSELRLMRTELADVRMTADVQVKADSFDKFVDVFWDGIFSSLSMLDRISSALASMRNARESILQTLARLESMRERAALEYAAAEEALQHFVETMPLP